MFAGRDQHWERNPITLTKRLVSTGCPGWRICVRPAKKAGQHGQQTAQSCNSPAEIRAWAGVGLGVFLFCGCRVGHFRVRRCQGDLRRLQSACSPGKGHWNLAARCERARQCSQCLRGNVCSNRVVHLLDPSPPWPQAQAVACRLERFDPSGTTEVSGESPLPSTQLPLAKVRVVFSDLQPPSLSQGSLNCAERTSS